MGLKLGLPAVLIVLAGACSWFRPGAAGEAMPADPDAITIIVQNNVMPPTAVTVYIIEEGGTSTRLGQMSGASTERFTPRIPPTGRARLHARSADGGERTSDFVSLRPSQTLEWDLFTNIVTQRFGGGSPDDAQSFSATPGVSASWNRNVTGCQCMGDGSLPGLIRS